MAVPVDPSVSQPLVASVLPTSRSVQVNSPATAFATVINTGASIATAVGISLQTAIPANFVYQTTNPVTNQTTGMPNTPVDIQPGQGQTYVLSITPTAVVAPTDVALNFVGTNVGAVPTLTGINTLLLSASTAPTADIVALAATVTHDGIVNIAGSNGTGAFAMATVNVGATATITASADTGATNLPVTILLCQTNPGTGTCLGTPATSVTTQISAGATPTFSIFPTGSGTISFDPANHRIFVRLKDGSGLTRGATSVAVRTQ